MRSLFRYSWIGCGVGVLLLTAAALKLHGLRVDPVPSLGILSATEFKVAVVEFEIFLGIWLVSGKCVIGSWLTSLLTFATFSLASAYQGWVGQASCGCFGRVSQWVSPWHALGLDLAVIALLVMVRPNLQALHAKPVHVLRGSFLTLASGLLGVLAVFGILAAAAYFAYGSTEEALAHLRAERLSVRPRLVDLGQCTAGEVRQVNIALSNQTNQPIRVIGGTSDCSCVVIQDLPITIEPGETRSIPVWVHFPASTGLFTRRAALLTDDDGARTISFRLTGRIVPAPSGVSWVTDGD